MFIWKKINFLSVLFVIALSKHKMVNITTVKGWGFKCLRRESEGSDQVKSVYCNICCEFYNNRNSTQSQGAVKKVVGKYISGTIVIKKANFEDHMKKSETQHSISLRNNIWQQKQIKINQLILYQLVCRIKQLFCLTFKHLQQ